jgi:hypothetical protein
MAVWWGFERTGITFGDPLKENLQKSKQGFAWLLFQGITSGDPFMGTCRSQSRDSLRVSPSVSMAAPHE